MPFNEKIVREEEKRFRGDTAFSIDMVANTDDILNQKQHSDTGSSVQKRKRRTTRKVDIPLPYSILETRNESSSYNLLKKLLHHNHRRRFKHLPPLA